MHDYIIKNPVYKYSKEGLEIIGNIYRDSWIYSGKRMSVKVEHLEDDLYEDSHNVLYKVEQ